MAPARPARRVDVNDVGPLIGEHDRGQGPGDVLPEVDHAQAGERARHRRSYASSGNQPQGWGPHSGSKTSPARMVRTGASAFSPMETFLTLAIDFQRPATTSSTLLSAS